MQKKMRKCNTAKEPVGDRVRYAANEYAKISTIHGFSYISNSNPSVPSRIFCPIHHWIIFFKL